jgi:hypothetical protein
LRTAGVDPLQGCRVVGPRRKLRTNHGCIR